MIHIDKLAFNYHKSKRLFNNLNIDLQSGEIIGFLGRNGAGKSTLLKLCSGLIRPYSGIIKVNKTTPFNRAPAFLEDIFLITEELYIPKVTVKKYIEIYASFYAKFDETKMKQILSEFELKLTDCLAELSHGQKKKFMIAFALSTNCKYLFLDEPTNGLDILSKRIFRKVLVNSVSDDQVVLISTHQVKDIDNIVDRIVVLEAGTIVFNKDVFSISNQFQFKYLENIDNNAKVLYSEKNIGGYKVILPLENNTETEIDLELLFNAIINKTEITF